MTGIPTLETERLVLRPFRDTDVDLLHKILSAPSVLKYFPRSEPPKLESVKRLVANQLEHWATHGYGWWAVEHRSAGELIGWCGLTYLPETNETEVAYLLAEPYWGQGLATEAAARALKFGFDQVKVGDIVGIVHPENLASQRVLEKIGFEFVEAAEYFGMVCNRYLVTGG
jgi:RimJ/RimL family protein N-acetyltransferase